MAFDFCPGCITTKGMTLGDTVVMTVLGPAQFLVRGMKLRSASYADYQTLDERYEVSLLSPLLALFGMIIGIIICVLAITLMSLGFAPRGFAILVVGMWKQPIEQPDRPVHGRNDSECTACFKCLSGACHDLHGCFVVVWRVLMTVLLFIGIFLYIVFSSLYGLLTGTCLELVYGIR